jgi:hypothetical protein
MEAFMIKSLLFSVLLFPLSSLALFDVETAIAQAVSEKLVYVGSYIPHWSASGTIPSCLYKNSKVFVLSNYCLKRPIPAASIRIHSADHKQGHVEIYAEGAVAGKDISTIQRRDYFEPLWRVAANPYLEGFDFKMSAKEYQKYEELESSALLRGCLNSDNFPETLCKVGYENEQQSWGMRAIEFRETPSKNWYLLLKTLKSLVP